MASTAVFCFALIIMGGLTLGSVGGELKATGPPAAAGGELKVTGPPAAGGIPAGKLKVPGPPAAGGGELKPPRSAGGNSAAVKLLPPPGSAASEFMPAGSAGFSALLRQELSLVDLGTNCSGFFCLWCLVENIGSCLADAISCEDDPYMVVECFVAKISIIADCFGNASSAGGEGQLTISGSAGATASKLVPRSAGGAGSAAPARATARTTARLSALLRNELAISDVGINCSDDCIGCLTDTIGSCLVDTALCFNPLELAVCLAQSATAIAECFNK